MHEFIYLVEKVNKHENYPDNKQKINEVVNSVLTALENHENNPYKNILEIYFLDF